MRDDLRRIADTLHWFRNAATVIFTVWVIWFLLDYAVPYVIVRVINSHMPP